MARRRRIFIPDMSVHVIQRGNNRMDIFREHRDYRSFLVFLERAAACYEVVIHAFVLMTNHFHLIVTPAAAHRLPQMMKEIGGRYVSYYNRKHDRIGTLWNGRYRGLLIEDERYWLTCLKYVEQNPVRAGMVSVPGKYPWSSYSAHAFGDWPSWLTPHPVYLALGHSAEERQLAYRSLCGAPLEDDQLTAVRLHFCTSARPIRAHRRSTPIRTLSQNFDGVRPPSDPYRVR
jgi:putative transposase